MQRSPRVAKREALPVNFQILSGKSAKSPVCPVLTTTLNNVQIIRTLDPEFLEPFVSAGRLFEACNLTIIDGLVQFDLRLPFYDTDLGMGLFTDIWLPLNRCRRIAQKLGVFDQLSTLLDWSSRKAYTLDDRTANELVHNWRMQDIADEIYSTREMLATDLKTPPQVLPGGIQVRTQINREDYWTGPPVVNTVRTHLILWSVRCYERHVHEETTDDGEDYCDRYWETYEGLLGMLATICGPSFPTADTFNDKVFLVGGKEISRDEAKEGTLLGQMITAKVISRAVQGIGMVGVRDEKFKPNDFGAPRQRSKSIAASATSGTLDGTPLKQTSFPNETSPKVPGIFPRSPDPQANDAATSSQQGGSLAQDSDAAGPSSMTVELLRRVDAMTSKVSRMEGAEEVYRRRLRKVGLLEKQNAKMAEKLEIMERKLHGRARTTSKSKPSLDLESPDEDLDAEDDETMDEVAARRPRRDIRRNTPAMQGNGFIGDLGDETNPPDSDTPEDDVFDDGFEREKLSTLRRRKGANNVERDVAYSTARGWLPGGFWGFAGKETSPKPRSRRNKRSASSLLSGPSPEEQLSSQGFPYTSIIILVVSLLWLTAFTMFAQ